MSTSPRRLKRYRAAHAHAIFGPPVSSPKLLVVPWARPRCVQHCAAALSIYRPDTTVTIPLSNYHHQSINLASSTASPALTGVLWMNTTRHSPFAHAGKWAAKLFRDVRKPPERQTIRIRQKASINHIHYFNRPLFGLPIMRTVMSLNR